MENIANKTTTAEMLSYFTQLNDTEKQSVVDLLKTFTKRKKENLTPQTLKDYNEELEQADAEINAGNYVTHEDVMKQFLAK